MAFGESWLISVMMRFGGNGPSYLARLASGVTAVEGGANRATAAMERLNVATTRIAARLAGVGIGLGIYAEFQASKLQRTLTAIRNETGADPRKMGSVYNSVFDIANRIGVAPTEAAQSWLDISRLTAGQLSVAQMRAIAPAVMQYASLINYNRPDVSVDEATKAGLQLMHQFRAYTPNKILPLLDQVYRLSGLMVEAPAQAVRQMAYYEPLFKGLKIDNQTSIAMMALLDRGGFRQKVGTNVRALMLESLGPLQMTKHAQAGKLGMLTEMGVFRNGQYAWNLPNGGVDYVGELRSIANWAMRKEAAGVPSSKIAQIIYGTLGRQGGNIGQFMADPQILGIFGDIQRYQRNPNVGIAAGIQNRSNDLFFQMRRSWGNLQGVITELGKSNVPTLTNSLRSLADRLNDATSWLHRNPAWERGITVGFASVTGYAGLRTVVGLLSKLTGLGNLSKALEGLPATTKAFKMIDATLSGGMVGRLAGTATGMEGVLKVAGKLSTALTLLTTSFSYVYDSVKTWQALMGGTATLTQRIKMALGPGGTLLWNMGADAYNFLNGHKVAVPNTHQIVIRDKTRGGILTEIRARGAIPSSPHVPGSLHLTHGTTLGIGP